MRTRVRMQDTDNCHKCPHCGTIDYDPYDINLITKTEPISTGDYEEFGHDPGLYWIELKKCSTCKKLYLIENGA